MNYFERFWDHLFNEIADKISMNILFSCRRKLEAAVRFDSFQPSSWFNWILDYDQDHCINYDVDKCESLAILCLEYVHSSKHENYIWIIGIPRHQKWIFSPRKCLCRTDNNFVPFQIPIDLFVKILICDTHPDKKANFPNIITRWWIMVLLGSQNI